MNSENQLKFKELFEKEFGDAETFMYTTVELQESFGLKLVSEDRTDVSDSYDFTDDVLENVYYHKELDLYVKFTGRDVSYSGESWNDNYEFVTPKIKEITIYE